MSFTRTPPPPPPLPPPPPIHTSKTKQTVAEFPTGSRAIVFERKPSIQYNAEIILHNQSKSTLCTAKAELSLYLSLTALNQHPGRNLQRTAISKATPLLLLLSTPLHQRAASRVQHPNHVAANSLSPQVARKGSTLSGFVQRSWLEREVGRDLHSNKWEEV